MCSINVRHVVCIEELHGNLEHVKFMTLLGDVFAMVMFFSSALAYAIYHGYVFF
jgi:hypothetical protein